MNFLNFSFTGCGTLVRRPLHPDHRGALDSRRRAAGRTADGVRGDRSGHLHPPVRVFGQNDIRRVAWRAASGMTEKSMLSAHLLNLKTMNSYVRFGT